MGGLLVLADLGDEEADQIAGEGWLNLNQLNGVGHSPHILLHEHHVGKGRAHVDFLVGQEVQGALVLLGILYLAGRLVEVGVELLQERKALAPLLHPFLIIGGSSLLRQGVIEGGGEEGQARAAGGGHVVGKAAGVILDPLVELLGGRRRIGDGFGVVGQVHAGAAIAHKGITVGLEFYIGEIGHQGGVNGLKKIC